MIPTTGIVFLKMTLNTVWLLIGSLPRRHKGCKFKVRKTFKTSSEIPTYVRFTSSVHGVLKNIYGNFSMMTFVYKFTRTELIFTVNNENSRAYFSEENLSNVNSNTTVIWWNCSKLTERYQLTSFECFHY